jgi:hypothetical protein
VRVDVSDAALRRCRQPKCMQSHQCCGGMSPGGGWLIGI